MNSNTQVKPHFFLYPKRKSGNFPEAVLYLRISYQFVNIHKSVGVKIPFELWDKQNHCIMNNPYHQKQVEVTCNELKEKIMGSFYLLSQNTASPTLREVMDLAFAANEKKSFSLFGVFSSLILRMEKHNTLKRQTSNTLKHASCMKHLKAFVKAHFNISVISFNRINRNFIDEFEMYLKTECGNEVLKSNYLHADETPIKVLDKDKNGGTHRGYYWVYQDSMKKIVFFDYQQSRGREGPTGILENFEGYLQTDGYTVYEAFDKRKEITLIHCMAHARRMFHDALENDKERAGYALDQIQQLYTIERTCKENALNFAEIKEVRQQKSAPILQALGKWMKEQYVQTTPKSAIGKALAYSIERWNRLSLYTQNGILNIDNNPVENSIRPVALGRKNYLFAGSHEAAQRSAMLYSLLGTCKMHGIEPCNWLRNTLEIITTHPINRIKELLPHYSK